MDRVSTVALAIASAICITVLSFVIGNDLVWDDVYFVEPFRRLASGGFAALGPLLTATFWEESSFVSHDLPTYWRPLTMVVLGLWGLLFGDWVPGFHLLSLLAALGAGASLLFLIHRVLGAEQRGLATWIGLVFVIHPLCAEVLCLVVNVGDHFALIFFNLQLVALVGELSGPSRRSRLVLAGVCGFLACCAKEVGVVSAAAPVLAWMLHRARVSSEPARGPWRAWPWIASIVPVALYLGTRSVVVSGAARSAFDQVDLAAQPFLLGPGQALLASVVPVPQGAHAFVHPGDIWSWAVAAAVWAGAIVLVVLFVSRRRSPGLGLAGIAIASVLLLPSMLAVSFMEGAWRFPVRYFHLPLEGLLIAVLPFVRKLSARLWLVGPLLVGLLALLSFVRIGEWRDERSFFEAEATYQPGSPFALANLSETLCRRGAFDEAEAAADGFDALAAPKDRASRTRVELVRAKIEALRDGDVGSATARLERVLEAEPTNLAALLTLTEVWAVSGRSEESLATVERALSSPRFEGNRRRMLEQYRQRYLELRRSGDGPP